MKSAAIKRGSGAWMYYVVRDPSQIASAPGLRNQCKSYFDVRRHPTLAFA